MKIFLALSFPFIFFCLIAQAATGYSVKNNKNKNEQKEPCHLHLDYLVDQGYRQVVGEWLLFKGDRGEFHTHGSVTGSLQTLRGCNLTDMY